MKLNNILIDSRRKVNSGVGRVSQWIANNINSSDYNNVNITYLVNSESLTSEYLIQSNNIIETSIKPFSENEFSGLPELLATHDFDLYINPQMSWSHLHTIPTINMIHDLWAIKNPEWLPSESDLKSRFKVNDISYFKSISTLLNHRTASRYLTPYGISQWEIANKSGNIIWLGSWAQYAAITSRSKRYVVVSPYVKAEIEKYFLNVDNMVLINNVPNDFGNIRPLGKKHFLTLSKLEKRKNIDFLLDSYIEYSNSTIGNKLPLIIAGDPGYKSIASKLIKRINELHNQGYEVSFKASVSDNELKDLLQNSAALIFPSHFEGFGLPPLEAMLAEVPVIATLTGMMATDLGKFAVLINGNDIYELSDHMRIVATQGYPKEVLSSAKNAVKQFVEVSGANLKWKNTILSCLTIPDSQQSAGPA